MSGEGSSSAAQSVGKDVRASGTAPPRIPDHELLRCIGEGSYGQVWLARNIMGEWRAVKVVYRGRFHEDERAYDREFTGIRLYEPISRSHESLVQILHVGRDDAAGYFYYVMELADDACASPNDEGRNPKEARNPNSEAPASNESIQTSNVLIRSSSAFRHSLLYVPRTLKLELVRHGRLPPKDCIATGAALATGLEQLHENKLVHRDIKPSNIIFVHGRPKLADIGLVTDADATLSFVGTMGFVAPEGPGTPAADIFALGKVLYEMATGLDRSKFPSLPRMEGLSEAERNHLRELNAVILKACASSAPRRHQSAAELRNELLALQSGVSIERQRALERAYGRFKVATGWALLAVLFGAFLFGVWSYRGRIALREALLAQAKLERKGNRTAGWFSNNWAVIQRAAAIRPGSDVSAVAAGALAGLDANPVCYHWDTVGGSAAFAPDGRLLIGGLLGSPALLIETNGVKRELPLRVEGPVCWTPEGMPLQFSATSNACLLHDVFTGQVRRHFPLAHGEEVKRANGPTLAMASDGRFVAASVSREKLGRVVVWDTATGEARGEASFSATVLAFSPDATVLAAGNESESVSVYALPGMTELLTLPPTSRPTPIRCLALTRDRLVREKATDNPVRWLLAVGYKGGEVIIWDSETGVVRSRCRGLSWNVSSLAFDRDGATLVAGGRSEVRLWDTVSGKELLWINHCGLEDCRALALSSDGSRLAWGTDAGVTRAAVGVLKLSRQRGIQSLRGLGTNPRAIWFSQDSQLVAAIADDWHVGVWEARSGRLIHIIEVPHGAVAQSAGGVFDASAGRFAFAAGAEARLYELGTGRTLKKWRQPKSGLMDQLQFDAAGRLLWLRRGPDSDPPGDRRWQLYELAEARTPVLLHQQTETNWVPYDTAFAAGGRQFLVWTSDATGNRPVFRAYDVASGQEQWQVTVEDCRQPSVCIDPTGRWFAYPAGRANRPKLVRLSDFKEFGLFPESCEAVGPNGDLFAQYIPEGHSVLHRHHSGGGLLMVSDSGGCFVPSFSPDGRLFAWGTFGGLVLVADLATVRQHLASLQRSAP